MRGRAAIPRWSANVRLKAEADRKSPIVAILGTNCIVARAERGFSQVELAKRSGISRATISKIENGIGDATLRTVEQLANALGWSFAAMFESGDDPNFAVSEAELVRRSETLEPSDFVDARAIVAAANEAAERYSKAGRPRMAR